MVLTSGSGGYGKPKGGGKGNPYRSGGNNNNYNANVFPQVTAPKFQATSNSVQQADAVEHDELWTIPTDDGEKGIYVKLILKHLLSTNYL